MYSSYFGLSENPFSITPDTRYLFLSERHAEALAHLLYGVTESGGFIQLTGEVGTGKTMLVRSLLEQLPENVDAAVVLNPRVSIDEFMHVICGELGIEFSRNESPQALIDKLNTHLLEAHARGRRTVVVIDEAQALATEVLEQLRLLTNLETRSQKLLQILLIGQPELRELLDRRDLRQLAQRITARYHLAPLSGTESRAYVVHRLRVAGINGTLFTNGALRKIHQLSAGIPRLINILCDRALLGAFAKEQRQVDKPLVVRAAREVFGPPRQRSWQRAGGWALAVASVLLIAAAGYALAARWQLFSGHTSVTTASLTANANDSTGTSHNTPVPADTAVKVKQKELAAALTPQDWLAAHQTDIDSAFAGLFKLWHRSYPTDGTGSACQRAQSAGLRCLYRTGTWNNLRAFNRPAIVTLVTSDGTTHQVVLTRLGKHDATLVIDGNKQDFALSKLDSLWYGEYLILWHPNPAADHGLHAGMQGSDVLWLRHSLDQIQHKPLSDNDHYDASLVDQVKDFQQAHHLDVDGIAGEETLVHINTALRLPDTPYLDETGGSRLADKLANKP